MQMPVCRRQHYHLRLLAAHAERNFSVTPTGSAAMQWAVSHRRCRFAALRIDRRSCASSEPRPGRAAAAGCQDSHQSTAPSDSGSPQHVGSARNSGWSKWTGSNWNMVFVGDLTPPAGEWPSPPYTKVATVPVVREKPFLYVDARGNYLVRLPALRRDSSGITWRGGITPGRSIPLNRFFIAHPGDTAAAINAQLAGGRKISSSLPASTSSPNPFASRVRLPWSSAEGSPRSCPSTAQPRSPPPMLVA